MNRKNKLLMTAGMFATLCSFSTEELTVHANEDGYNFLSAGVAQVLGVGTSDEEELADGQDEFDVESDLEMEEDGLLPNLVTRKKVTGHDFLSAGVTQALGSGAQDKEEQAAGTIEFVAADKLDYEADLDLETDPELIKALEFETKLEFAEDLNMEAGLELVENPDLEIGMESEEILEAKIDIVSERERMEQEFALQEAAAGYDFLSTGAAEIFELTTFEREEPVKKQAAFVELNIDQKFEAEKKRMAQELTMANVQNVLNIRAQASEDSEKVGVLYKDCGGTILERKDGWTKLKSGSVIGWAKDEYLLFGEEAKEMAEDVGNWIVTLDTDAVRVRMEPSVESDVYGLLAHEDSVDFIDTVKDGWISVDYNGETGYVNSDYINVKFHIDEGESMDVIKIREREEEERRRKAEEQKRKENRGAVAADADEVRLLGALIYCEAGNQSYEGMVGVGAVVMNRVKSGAYPNTIHSVIYASGQFTPALTGGVARVYAGKVPDACMRAAQAAINGETTVGGATHFKRAGQRDGYVLGDHVFW